MQHYESDALDASTLVMPLVFSELASVYRPAAGAAMVGGDFYDLIRLSESSWLMVVGDVQGKGPAAGVDHSSTSLQHPHRLGRRHQPRSRVEDRQRRAAARIC